MRGANTGSNGPISEKKATQVITVNDENRWKRP